MYGVNGVGPNYVNAPSTTYQYKPSNQEAQYSNIPVVHGGRKSHVNTDALEYLQSIRMNAEALSDSFGSLTQLSSFQAMAAALPVQQPAPIRPVEQAAPATDAEAGERQVSEGAELPAAEPFASAGIQQFEIETGGGRRQAVTLNVADGESNVAVQHRMADAINRKTTAVNASVRVDVAAGTSVLELASSPHRSGESFAVRDVVGSLAAETGVHQASQGVVVQRTTAPEAGRTAPSEAASSNAKPLVGPPVTAQRVEGMVEGYNSLLSAAQNSPDGGRLQEDLLQAVHAYSPALNSVGIHAGDDGRLAIDSMQLGRALEDGSAQQQFGRTADGSGFADRMAGIIGNIQSNPAAYVGRAADEEIVSYSPTGPKSAEEMDTLSSQEKARSVTTQVYSQYFSLGYLFDLFV